MIEVRQESGHTNYKVFDGGTPICTVDTIWRRQGGFHGPDWPATRARAEHIAEALRHYQASQEAETTP